MVGRCDRPPFPLPGADPATELRARAGRDIESVDVRPPPGELLVHDLVGPLHERSEHPLGARCVDFPLGGRFERTHEHVVASPVPLRPGEVSAVRARAELIGGAPQHLLGRDGAREGGRCERRAMPRRRRLPGWSAGGSLDPLLPIGVRAAIFHPDASRRNLGHQDGPRHRCSNAELNRRRAPGGPRAPAGPPARMSPPSHARSSPVQSVTTPPASSINSPPAATSHGASASSKKPSNTPSATHARSSAAAPGRRRSSNAAERGLERPQVPGQQVLPSEREPGADHGARGFPVGHAQPAAVRRHRGPATSPRRARRSRSSPGTARRRPPPPGPHPEPARPRPPPPRTRARSSSCRRADRPPTRRRCRPRRSLRRGRPTPPPSASSSDTIARSAARSTSVT